MSNGQTQYLTESKFILVESFAKEFSFETDMILMNDSKYMKMAFCMNAAELKKRNNIFFKNVVEYREPDTYYQQRIPIYKLKEHIEVLRNILSFLFGWEKFYGRFASIRSGDRWAAYTLIAAHEYQLPEYVEFIENYLNEKKVYSLEEVSHLETLRGWSCPGEECKDERCDIFDSRDFEDMRVMMESQFRFISKAAAPRHSSRVVDKAIAYYTHRNNSRYNPMEYLKEFVSWDEIAPEKIKRIGDLGFMRAETIEEILENRRGTSELQIKVRDESKGPINCLGDIMTLKMEEIKDRKRA